MKRIALLTVFLVAILLACAPKVASVKKPLLPEIEIPRSQKAEESAPGGWQTEWEKSLVKAKKEGSLVISTGRNQAMRDRISRDFKNKYGLDIEWIVGSGAQTSARIAAERRAGLYSNDISIDGGNTSLTRYKVSGFLEALPPVFILPEVRDLSAWIGGKFPFLDSEGLYVFSLTLYPQSPIMYNTDLIAQEEINSFQKLLDPKWKGKFISGDFTLTGGPHKWFSSMIEEDFGPILGLDYMRALAKQEPLIIRDDRLGGEWLMRGKYPFGLNISIESQLAEWRRQGIRVPLDDFTPKEGGYLTTGGQNLTFFKNAPHPNAAKIFINWVLSKDGAVSITRASVKHSARIDIGDAKEIEPQVIMRQPGAKYVMPDQEKYLLKTEEYTRLAKEIFGHLLK